MMTKAYDIISVGHICLDISPKFTSINAGKIEDIFVPGRLINLSGADFSPGGSVGNTGFAISRLGLDVLPMAAIGNDEFGAILSDIIKKEVGIDITRRDAFTTSYSLVLSLPGIDRIILHDPAGNDLINADDVDYETLKNAKLMHFGYPPLMRQMFIEDGKQLALFFKRAKETGITTSLDMSLPDLSSESGQVDWHRVLESTLPYVDVFMPSIEEAMFMLDNDEYEKTKALAKGDDFTNHLNMNHVCALGEKIIDMGCAMTLIKCGANGIYFKSTDTDRLNRMGRAKPENLEGWARREVFRETYVVENFKSALAGGDTTIAGFLSAMLKGYDLYDSLKIACKTGALCCSTYDSISGLLPLDDIYKKTISEPKRNVFNPKVNQFSFDKESLIWISR